MRKQLFYYTLILTFFVLTGCSPKDTIRPKLPPAIMTQKFTVNEYSLDIDESYAWLLCADRKYYYAAGVQELMDDASRPVKVYSFDPNTKEKEQIDLPRGDDWHLYSMIPAENEGFWMVFTPITPNSNFNYVPREAYLVKTDSDFHELFSICLEEYSQELINIMGVCCPKSSEYAKEMMEETEYVTAPKENFFKAVLACDKEGNVYITSPRENIIVFDSNGRYIGEYATFDVSYSSGVYLVQTNTGNIVEGRSDADNHVLLIDLNSYDFTIKEKYEQEQSEYKILEQLAFAPIPSISPEYSLFAVDYYGIFGIRTLKNGKYEVEPLVYYDEIGLPYDMYVHLNELERGKQLIFEKKFENEKRIQFFSLLSNCESR